MAPILGARARRRTGLAAVTTAAAALVLSGCGINPGQAAVVGDTDISPSEVDDTAAVVCLVDQSVEGVQSLARRKAVEFLVGTTLVEAFGRSERATPTGGQLSRSPALAQIQADAEPLPAEVRQDYVDTITRLVASQQTLINVGQRETGADDAAAAADPQGALAAGSAAYSAWLEEQGPEVSVDPRYGRWEGSQLVSGDSSLSVAVSDQAQQIADGAAPLPATQACS